MGLTGSRDDFAVSASEAYHAYGRAALRSPRPSSAKRPRETNAPPTTMSPANGPVRDGASDEDDDDDRLVAKTFTWNFGGQSVCVTGAWDGWREKTRMERNGTEFRVVIFVPCGEYQFKYFVDENWQCNPAIDQQTDENGNTNNYVKVVAQPREFDTSEPVHSPPPSPPESYDKSVRHEFEGDVPLLPVQIAPFATHEENKHIPEPQRGSAYVRYNHMYMNPTDDEVHTLSIMERHNQKTITTLFVTSAEGKAAPAQDRAAARG